MQQPQSMRGLPVRRRLAHYVIKVGRPVSVGAIYIDQDLGHRRKGFGWDFAIEIDAAQQFREISIFAHLNAVRERDLEDLLGNLTPTARLDSGGAVAVRIEAERDGDGFFCLCFCVVCWGQ